MSIVFPGVEPKTTATGGGTLSSQDANAVAITGGNITGVNLNGSPIGNTTKSTVRSTDMQVSGGSAIDPDSVINTLFLGNVADGSGFAVFAGVGFSGNAAGRTGAFGFSGDTWYLGIGDGAAANSLGICMQIQAAPLASKRIHIPLTAASTSTSTGALTVAGGFAAGGAINAAGAIAGTTFSGSSSVNGLVRSTLANPNTGASRRSDLAITTGTGTEALYLGLNGGVDSYIDNRSGGSLKLQTVGTTHWTIDTSGNLTGASTTGSTSTTQGAIVAKSMGLSENLNVGGALTVAGYAKISGSGGSNSSALEVQSSAYNSPHAVFLDAVSPASNAPLRLVQSGLRAYNFLFGSSGLGALSFSNTGTGGFQSNFQSNLNSVSLPLILSNVNAAIGYGAQFNYQLGDGTNLYNCGGLAYRQETAFTGTASTQNAYVTLSSMTAGNATEKLRVTSGGRLLLGTTSDDGANIFQAAGSISAQGAITGTILRTGSYTVATVPSASTNVGGSIFVSNESGGATTAFSDGTNWRRVHDRAIIS